MKIIISGGAGLVGSHCAEYFSRKGNKIVVVDNLMRSEIFGSKHKSVEYNWHYLSKLNNIKLLKKDIRDKDAMMRLFKREKPDVVIHTAGQPGVRFSIDHPMEDFSINGIGSLILLEALSKVNKKGKFIYCSTNKVYGNNVNSLSVVKEKMRYRFKDVKGVSEEFNIDSTGHTPYGVSKLVGDLYAQDYAYVYGLKCGIFRMSCIYGSRQFGFEDQGWLAWFAIRYYFGKPITIYGDGKQIRDVLWVEDLVKAYDAFIKSTCDSGVFNMGGGHTNTISLLELMQLLEKETGNKVKVNYEDWRKFDQKVYVSDISRAKRILKWQPKVSPHEGIKRLLKWIAANPDLFK